MQGILSLFMPADGRHKMTGVQSQIVKIKFTQHKHVAGNVHNMQPKKLDRNRVDLSEVGEIA